MYVLHGVDDWGSLVVHIMLEELGVPFRFRPIDYEAGGLQASEFRALNPFGKVPVLETPDGPIHETAAVLLYLAEKHGALMPASDSPERVRFLIWFALITNQVHPQCLLVLHPDWMGIDGADIEVATAAHKALLPLLEAAEAEAARGRGWLSTDDVSVVSLWLVMILRWLRLFSVFPEHQIMTSAYPSLFAIAQAIETRPAVARVLAREGLPADAFSASTE